MSTKNIIPKFDVYENTVPTSNWETKYQQLLTECLNPHYSFEVVLKINMYLIHFMGEFVKYAKGIVAEIINDFLDENRRFNLSVYKNSKGERIENYYGYHDEKNKTTVKIAWSSSYKERRGLLFEEETFYSEQQLKLLGKGELFLKFSKN